MTKKRWLHGEHFPHFLVRMRKVVTHWNTLSKEVVESLCVDVHLGSGLVVKLGIVGFTVGFDDLRILYPA